MGVVGAYEGKQTGLSGVGPGMVSEREAGWLLDDK